MSDNLIIGFLTIAFIALAIIFFFNTRKSLATGVGRIKTVVCSRHEHPIGFWFVTTFSGGLCLLSAYLAGLLAHALITT
ncbi:MAG: hypothetical protein P0Y64_01155 [Candidatus Sphingomonas colombiensis]|nr:hypothetical protein [Sphingomonas sp.]WEK43479.1 MAG: hypothetical protein P0Y64_01155 [Sphingomonas sp.]